MSLETKATSSAYPLLINAPCEKTYTTIIGTPKYERKGAGDDRIETIMNLVECALLTITSACFHSVSHLCDKIREFRGKSKEELNTTEEKTVDAAAQYRIVQEDGKYPMLDSYVR